MTPSIAFTWSSKSSKIIVSAGFAVALLLIATIVFVSWHWPFRRNGVLQELEKASQSRVGVDRFHATYFPRPGCVLESVRFQHNPAAGSPPLITIQRLRIESSFSGLFAKRLRRIRAEGLRLLIPPRGTEHFQTPERSRFEIEDLIADGAILEVGSRNVDKPPLKFSFHHFVLSNIGSRSPALFHANFSNPQPPGEITTSGKFGPWNPDAVAKTAVSGEYLFQQADLGVFRGIAGQLSSSGNFSGTLSRMEVQGGTDSPRFTVTSSSHQVQLRTQFHAVVNGENGDTFLQRVVATFWKTTVSSEANVAGVAGQPGKTASVELTAKDGRIQDLLLLFIRSQRAPLSGTVSFHAKVSIPPGKRPFLEKVHLQGDFGIDAASFTKPETQHGVNHLSEGASGGETPDKAEKETQQNELETVLSDLKGHVVLKDGTAKFSNLSFSVPGAWAQMQGTYNLLTEKIDLHGSLRTDSEPSKTTHGVKTLMLKLLEPFFKKKPAGYTMPVRITGTYDHPSFGLDLGNRDSKKAKENARALGIRNNGPH
jgi:hypothetical protein